MKHLCLSVLVALSVLAGASFAQDGVEIKVGEIDLSSLKWGYQNASFEVTNTTDYLKFVKVVNTITFEGSFLNPSRTEQSSFVLGPLESKILTPRIHVPENYGRAVLIVSLYDVIDTTDLLLPMQKFFEQPITLNYHMPDAMIPYLTTPITLPPMVDKHQNWDCDLSRALLLLLRDGKTIEEIADMAQTSPVVVRNMAEELTVYTALTKLAPDSYEPTFAVIHDKEAELFSPLAHRAADTLASMIRTNLPVYRARRDSLSRSGVFSSDTLDFLNGGAILYREYPAILSFLLWDKLGKEFVTLSKDFNIFEGTDLCNAYAPFYMYAVQGGSDYHGRQFFSRNSNSGYPTYIIADHVPTIICEENYRQKAKERKSVAWDFGETGREGFMYDRVAIELVIPTFLTGHEQFIPQLQKEFETLVKQQSFKNFAFGPRYWFWDWVSTLALDQLIKDGTVTRRNIGLYMYQTM